MNTSIRTDERVALWVSRIEPVQFAVNVLGLPVEYGGKAFEVIIEWSLPLLTSRGDLQCGGEGGAGRIQG